MYKDTKACGDRELSYHEQYWLKNEGTRNPLNGEIIKLDFIDIFKKERLEEGGKNDQRPPTLFEMVLIELLAKVENLETIVNREKDTK